ncbi:putative histone-lysine N-methyltransferase PRDM7 [Araneus ventricosus]|uniref:Putative histone-lysine N-methyltransferase PRDM7 n=1 Tax=Araneus ventricosus TaxID=182803 RepID=A0A4Y2K794_ARAVE|nr:putative histone-lysine N-methyltransferase PRDM7 [Araneus ventricosus]
MSACEHDNSKTIRAMGTRFGAGATSDISMVMETNSPSSKTMTRTIINFRGVKLKEFGKNILNSAQNSLKLLEDLFKDLDLNNTLEDEDEHLSEPGCSKNIPKRRYPKRKIAKKSYKEKDNVKDEDDFLDCELCKKEHKGPCPVHGAMLQVLDTKVPKGEPQRAKRTLPYFFSIGISSIRKAGLGVWTEMPLIEGMVFGPFEGKILKKNEMSKASEYMWEVKKQSKVHHCIDASDASSSNWMRYVNCADDEEWQTMTAFQYMGKIYYKTYKPVLPYTEILIWYGDDYACKFGIELKGRKYLPPPSKNGITEI